MILLSYAQPQPKVVQEFVHLNLGPEKRGFIYHLERAF